MFEAWQQEKDKLERCILEFEEWPSEEAEKARAQLAKIEDYVKRLLEDEKSIYPVESDATSGDDESDVDYRND